MLKFNFDRGKIIPFSHPRGAPLISHLLYADDISVFANGGRSSIKIILEIFDLYADWSGQMVSKENFPYCPLNTLKLVEDKTSYV